MKSLLRSVFIVQPSESEKESNANFSYLLASGLVFDLEEDQKIWTFIRDFYQAQGHIPQVSSIRSHFERGREPSIVDRLEQVIIPERILIKGDFLSHLQNVVEDKKTKTVVDLSKEMIQIVRTGLEIQEGRNKTLLRGSNDAVRYFLDRSSGLLSPITGGRLSGNVNKDGRLFEERYRRIKMDPSFGVGQYCGIRQIDEAFRGAQKKKLWIHAAWPGHLKSSFALHWAYVQSVYFGYPSLYFSLEMPYEEQVLNYIYTMHSAHEDFAEVRQVLGIEGLGLDYNKVKYGELNKKEEEFLFKFVVPDLNKEATVEHNGSHSLDPKDYGDLLIDCYDPDKADFTVEDLRSKAEVLYQQVPFHMIFVDHVLLMEASRRYSSTTEKLNEIVKRLKQLAMSFNHGAGMAVLGLWQISRAGYDYALKNDGKYNMTALNYANETEKSADIITAAWFGEDARSVKRVFFQCLKSRDDAHFERFAARVEPECRRILTDLSSMEEIEQEIRIATGQDSMQQQLRSPPYSGRQPTVSDNALRNEPEDDE